VVCCSFGHNVGRREPILNSNIHGRNERCERERFWQATEPGGTLALPFDLAEAGTYELMLVLTNSWNCGIFEVQSDGKPMGKPLDLHHPSVITREYMFEPQTLSAGRHTFTFRNVGKSGASQGYFFGFDCFLVSSE